MPFDAMDIAQRVFDAVYALWPRSLEPGRPAPILVGHRGVYRHPRYRENTLGAFELAVSRGGALEMDLRLSADGRPVVIHDEDLGRVFGGELRVERHSLPELQAAAPELPDLEQVLGTFGRACPHYFLEIKVYQPESELERLLRAVGQALERHGLASRTTILALDPRPLEAARRVLPDLPRAYVFGAWPGRAREYVERTRDTGMAGWYFSFPRSMRPWMTRAGLHQGVGFVNYRNTLHHYTNLGFPYLFTDRIDRLRP